MNVSIIIVNYNTLRLTNECINSIVEKTKGIDYEIILVDNASNDGSKEFFENDSRIKYIYSELNGGFGYGNNIGMNVAKGKYFFLLNSDTLLVNNAIKEFYDYAEAQNEKYLYGCYLMHDDGSYCSSFFYFPAFNVKSFLKRILGLKKEGIIDYVEKNVEAISGADMFFHREIYDRTGGFDENIFLYGEEGEWEYRIQKIDYSCKIIPQPQIIHLEGKSMKMSPAKMAIKWRSHFYILKKHMCYPTYLLARCFYACNLSIRNLTNIFNEEYKAYWKAIFGTIKIKDITE